MSCFKNNDHNVQRNSLQIQAMLRCQNNIVSCVLWRDFFFLEFQNYNLHVGLHLPTYLRYIILFLSYRHRPTFDKKISHISTNDIILVLNIIFDGCQTAHSLEFKVLFKRTLYVFTFMLLSCRNPDNPTRLNNILEYTENRSQCHRADRAGATVTLVKKTIV